MHDPTQIEISPETSNQIPAPIAIRWVELWSRVTKPTARPSNVNGWMKGFEISDFRFQISRGKGGSLHGMQRNAIAFAIQNDSAKAIRPNRMSRLEHFASIFLDLGHCLIEPALAI